MFSMESVIDPGGDLDVTLYVVLSIIGLCLEGIAFGRVYQMTMGWLRRRSGGERGAITYPPNRTQGVVGIVWSGIFTLAGLLAIIPLTVPFGVLWTLFAALISWLHIYQTFLKHYAKARTEEGRRRLEQLESLRAAGLLTEREYRERQSEILREL